jgi:hypothetical protein
MINVSQQICLNVGNYLYLKIIPFEVLIKFGSFAGGLSLILYNEWKFLFLIEDFLLKVLLCRLRLYEASKKPVTFLRNFVGFAFIVFPFTFGILKARLTIHSSSVRLLFYIICSPTLVYPTFLHNLKVFKLLI